MRLFLWIQNYKLKWLIGLGTIFGWIENYNPWIENYKLEKNFSSFLKGFHESDFHWQPDFK